MIDKCWLLNQNTADDGGVRGLCLHLAGQIRLPSMPILRSCQQPIECMGRLYPAWWASIVYSLQYGRPFSNKAIMDPAGTAPAFRNRH